MLFVLGVKNSSDAKLFRPDASDLPFDAETVVSIVSRGSLFFWPDRSAVYKEVHRVLAPGGVFWIVGGFGNAELKEKIFEKMWEKFDD